MRVVVVGAGAVGARAARQVLSADPPPDLSVVDTNPARAEAVVTSLGPPASVSPSWLDGLERDDVVLLAIPPGHAEAARQALERGAHVVSTSDSLDDVRALLELDETARAEDRHLVVGAGFSPGLACVLAAHAGRLFDQVDEVHVAKVGTGGPACARQHHLALTRQALEWREGEWVRQPAGSGRQLCWFPDPVRAVDCYRAGLAEVALLAPAFPGARRISARVGASRRDRLTAGLPMLRRPHPEGNVGAVRVEVRGAQGRARDDQVLGAVDRPAVAAGTVAALACRWAATGKLNRVGAGGLAELAEPAPFLSALAERGVKAAVFEGSSRTAAVLPRT